MVQTKLRNLNRVCMPACVSLCVCLTHKYNPNVSEFGFFPDPKTGEGAGVHAVQKLGYAVLNVAVQRLSQEEVKLMCSTHTHARTRALVQLFVKGKETLHFFLVGKLSLCIAVIMKQFSAD